MGVWLELWAGVLGRRGKGALAWVMMHLGVGSRGLICACALPVSQSINHSFRTASISNFWGTHLSRWDVLTMLPALLSPVRREPSASRV